MTTRVLLLSFSLILFYSCFETNSKKRLEVENLILNECESVIHFAEAHFEEKILNDNFVVSCGCISDIITEDIADKHSMEKLKMFKDIPYEFVKEIEWSMKKNTTKIAEECFSKNA
jgi:hypothetical protein